MELIAIVVGLLLAFGIYTYVHLIWRNVRRIRRAVERIAGDTGHWAGKGVPVRPFEGSSTASDPSGGPEGSAG